MKQRRRPKQLELSMNTWGGARKDAGRPRESEQARVPHVARTFENADHPVHVTLHIVEGLPSLRQPAVWAVIIAVFQAMRERTDFRIVHYSVMSNHLHLIIEADSAKAYLRGMKALLTRLAIRINRVFDRKGPLFEDRYHAHVLTTPTEVRNAMVYVLLNARKHAAQSGKTYPPSWLDPFSSAAPFDGWSRPVLARGDLGTSAPRTWLLCEGWRRAGAMDPSVTPGAKRKAA
jgi:REP-associated tyrosine transposase